jgi:SAM-dependent methyltransferase
MSQSENAELDGLACDLCGSSDRDVVGRISRNFRPLVNVVCRNCGLMRQDPMPTEAQLRDYYARRYRLSSKGSAEPRPRDLARNRRDAELWLTMLAPVLKPGMRILDVGSGTGMFLLRARQRGYQVQGIELDARYSARLKEQHDLPIHNGPWYTARFAPRSFDLVVMHHVLEHLRNPTAALRRIHEWTADGGHFYLSVPNMKNPSASPLNRFQPAHLHGFSPETLQMTALKAGFEKVDLPDFSNTQLVLRRLPQAAADWFIYPQHGADMVEFFRQHTMLKHIMRPQAYVRWARHIRRGVVDRLSIPTLNSRRRG